MERVERIVQCSTRSVVRSHPHLLSVSTNQRKKKKMKKSNRKTKQRHFFQEKKVKEKLTRTTTILFRRKECKREKQTLFLRNESKRRRRRKNMITLFVLSLSQLSLLPPSFVFLLFSFFFHFSLLFLEKKIRLCLFCWFPYMEMHVPILGYDFDTQTYVPYTYQREMRKIRIVFGKEYSCNWFILNELIRSTRWKRVSIFGTRFRLMSNWSFKNIKML